MFGNIKLAKMTQRSRKRFGKEMVLSGFSITNKHSEPVCAHRPIQDVDRNGADWNMLKQVYKILPRSSVGKRLYNVYLRECV